MDKNIIKCKVYPIGCELIVTIILYIFYYNMKNNISLLV